MIKKAFTISDRFNGVVTTVIPEAILALIIRLGIFFVFWRSAQTKLGGDSLLGQKAEFWNISESTFMLFEYDYQVPLLSSSIAAHLGTWGEFFFSLGILFGFMTRLSALGLLFTSLVILYVYPEDWLNVLLWSGLLLYLLKHGGGTISLDNLIRKQA